MDSLRFEWQIATNDPSVTRCHAYGNIPLSGRVVGGYIDSSVRGITKVFLPWVEVSVSVTDCATVEDAKAQVEQLSARLLAVIAAWEAEVQEAAR